MKKKATIFPMFFFSHTVMALLYTFFSSPIFSQGVWTQMNNFPGTARTFAVAFAIGSKGYMGTGQSAAGTYLNDFWEYNPATDTWTQKASCSSVGRYGAVGFSIGTKGYIGTGQSASALLNDFWEYNPSTNTWTQKANYGGGQISGSAGFGINSTLKGYLGGMGLDNASNFTKVFYEYDQGSNTWTSKAQPPWNFSSPCYRYWGVAWSIGTKGYLMSGMTLCGSYAKDLYEYTPSTNSWASKTAYAVGATNYGIWNSTGFSISTKGFLVTGEDEAGAFPALHRAYTQSSNTWANMANFPGTGRQGSTSFAIGNCGYVIMGRDASYTTLSQVWQWCDPTLLPIELLSFNGETIRDRTTHVRWISASEKNNDYYTLERSMNGVDFDAITNINGAGNSTTSNYYSHTDYEVPDSGDVVYYRVKQTDFDNSTSYSSIIAIELPSSKENSTSVYFDAGADELVCYGDFFPAKNVVVEVTDLSGRVLVKKNLDVESKGKNKYLVSVPGFSPGIYVARFSKENTTVLSQTKFVK